MKKLNLFTELCGIILGAGIYGLAVTGINIPSKLADGGVTGIALLLHNLLDSLLLSLHCFLIYLYCLSHCFFWKTRFSPDDRRNICASFLFTFMGEPSYTFCCR